MYKVFVLLTTVSCAFSCKIFIFEEGIDEIFSTESGICAVPDSTWLIGTYESIKMEGFHKRSKQFISPNEQFSCVSSPPFVMDPGGIIEVNMFMTNNVHTDFIHVTVSDKNNADAGSVTQWGHDFVGGWSTIQIKILGLSSFEGLISILGVASAKSTVLIDSIRYLPPAISKSDCLLYEIDDDSNNVTTEGTTIDTIDRYTDYTPDNNIHDTTTADANGGTEDTTFAVTDDTSENITNDGTTINDITDDTIDNTHEYTADPTTYYTSTEMTDGNTHDSTDATNYYTPTGDANSCNDGTTFAVTDDTLENVTNDGITINDTIDDTNEHTHEYTIDSTTDYTTAEITDDNKSDSTDITNYYTPTGDANRGTDGTTFAIADESSENVTNDGTTNNDTTDDNIDHTHEYTVDPTTDFTTAAMTDANTHDSTDVTNDDTTTGDENSGTDGTTIAVTDENITSDGTTISYTTDDTVDHITNDIIDHTTDYTVDYTIDYTTDEMTANSTHDTTDFTSYDTTTGDPNSNFNGTTFTVTDGGTDNITNDTTDIIPTDSIVEDDKGEQILTSPAPICDDRPKYDLIARLKIAVLVAVNISAEIVAPQARIN